MQKLISRLEGPTGAGGPVEPGSDTPEGETLEAEAGACTPVPDRKEGAEGYCSVRKKVKSLALLHGKSFA